ncbi:MAG: hypothetical protein HQL63_01235 [Magnetococcales bacterium]|nr:hypothetical protein [Magnetococcales bacterium]MBF0321516.1 hypothetical protein [Magnetococcales bacterium]
MSGQSRLQQQGSMAVTAIILIAVLGTAGIVLSRMYQSSKTAESENTAGDRAFNLAEAGAQSVLAQLKASNCDPTLLAGKAMNGNDVVITQTISGQGVFSVTFHPTGAPNTWSVSSVATGSRRITNFPSLSCGSSAGCSYAVVGRNNNNLSVGNNTEVNSHSVSSCGGGTCNVLDASGARQSASVSLTALPTYVASTLADGNKSGGPLGAGNYHDITIGNNGTLTFNTSEGAYYMNNLTLGNNVTVNMAPGTYHAARIQFGNNNNLVVTPSGVVKIFVNIQADIGNNANLNHGGNVANLGFYSYGSFQVGNNAHISGVVYAPGSATQVQLGNNTELTGSVISGGQVAIGNNTEITYDSAASAAVTALGISCGGGGGGGGTITHGTWGEQF